MDYTKFDKFKDKNCVLVKIGSRRSSMVGVGKSESEGVMHLHEYPLLEGQTEHQAGVFITGRGFSFLRTSPIVKITEETDKKIKFETEGGIYVLALDEPETTYHCEECKKDGEVKDMTLKIGGLLCPDCRVILVYPGSAIFSTELCRRRNEEE